MRFPGAVGCAYHACQGEATHVQFGRARPGDRAGRAWDVCAEHASKARPCVRDPRKAAR